MKTGVRLDKERSRRREDGNINASPTLSSHKRVHHGFVRNKVEKKTDVQSCQPERSFQLWATGNSHGLLKRETTQLGLIAQTFTACLSRFLLWIT